MIGLITQARRVRAGDEGFALPFVLLVTMLVMAGTATLLGVAAANIAPAKNSQDSEAALAAAKAGIQIYAAELSANCGTSVPASQSCTWLSNHAALTNPEGVNPVDGAPALPTGAAYSVTVTQRYPDDGTVRITSTGTSSDRHRSMKLVANLSRKPGVLRFAYFTNHESVDPNFLTSYYPGRGPIHLGGSSFTTKLLSLLGLAGTFPSVTWNPITNAQACAALWDSGRSGADGATEATTSGTSNTLPCSVYLTGPSSKGDPTGGMTFNGPVYSHDTFNLSDGLPNGPGPAFQTPPAAETLPAVSSGAPATAFQPSTLVNVPANAPVHSPFALSLPSSVSDVSELAGVTGLNYCTFTGPVSITLNGDGTASASPSPSTGPCSGASFSVRKSGSYSGTVVYTTGDATISNAGELPAATPGLTAGRLSIVAGRDIIVNGNVTASAATHIATNQFGQNSFDTNLDPHDANADPNGGAIDLVAQNDVVIKHQVACVGTAVPVTPTPGADPNVTPIYCNNDSSGLYTTPQAGNFVNPDGTLMSNHPARQYQNSSPDTGNCDTGANQPGRTINAAVFALTGSLLTQNFNRGCALGQLQVTGGVYQAYRGAIGQQWEVLSSGSTVRSYSGYKLSINYESLQSAALPYVPTLQGGTPTQPWQVISVSGGTS